MYITPGPHGFTPRDIDRRWSVASPLANDLSPLETMEVEPLSDYVQRLFAEYRTIRDRVLKWYANSSEKRAKLANRFRKVREIQVGMRVVYRDPRVRAAGGRTPWKQPLSEPLAMEAVEGNKLKLRRKDGTLVYPAHIEDCIVVPERG